ncbi:hypothetical protein [Vibrio gallaecicus]|uniref:hypothetical protein n=1 Tax=Vibrio gallaecicus TaxID=552386 RepID=UPI0025B33728|nr:hypothetical protein [Vibrio gallaecicus]MDN3613326.1 hypothetical protein [Vibrio gallaecicus]
MNEFNRRLVLVTEFQKLVLAFIQRKQMVQLQEVSLWLWVHLSSYDGSKSYSVK